MLSPLPALTLCCALARAAETIHDLELAIKLEIPVYATPSVRELELGAGESELHFGFRGDFAYVLSDRWALTGAVGTRRQYLYFEPEDEALDTPRIQSRVLRLEAGGRLSVLDPPTFLVFTGGLGWVSAFWGLDYAGLTGDRVSRGGGAYLGVGVDHFFNPRFALSGELRGWGELTPAETLATDPFAFEMPAARAGVSLLVGFTFR